MNLSLKMFIALLCVFSLCSSCKEKMTKDEIVKKNISLSFDFIRYLIKNPEIIDKVSDDSEIEFFASDLLKLLF